MKGEHTTPMQILWMSVVAYLRGSVMRDRSLFLDPFWRGFLVKQAICTNTRVSLHNARYTANPKKEGTSIHYERCCYLQTPFLSLEMWEIPVSSFIHRSPATPLPALADALSRLMRVNLFLKSIHMLLMYVIHGMCHPDDTGGQPGLPMQSRDSGSASRDSNESMVMRC